MRSSGIKPFLVFFWSIKFTEKIWAEAEVDLVLLSNIKIVRKAGIVTVTEVITLKIGIAELITEEKVITEVITVERVEVGNITEVGEGVDHPHEIGKSKGPEIPEGQEVDRQEEHWRRQVKKQLMLRSYRPRNWMMLWPV